jgi:hypothetical protein
VGHVEKKRNEHWRREKKKKEQIKFEKRNEKKENWKKQQDLNMRGRWTQFDSITLTIWTYGQLLIQLL